MQICIGHEVTVDTNGGYASSINGKVECTKKRINNMVRIQLLPRGHSDELWCLCYQYTIWIISRLIKICLGTAPIVAWYKQKNIYYIITL